MSRGVEGWRLVEAKTHNRPRARVRVEVEPGRYPPASPPLGTQLHTLAARVAGLHQSWTDPEAFHVEKFTLASELRRLAREVA